MSLTFLFPLALLGAVLLAVPLILHLIDKRRVPRLELPTLRFLMAAQKRLKRRRRLRDPWLLLLRLLGLLALVLAFAAPQVRYRSTTPTGAELGGNVVFLLDNSLSMSYARDGVSLLERARSRVEGVLDRMPEEARAGLIVFSRQAEDVTGGVTPDLSRVRSALEELEPSYEETDLKAAILAGIRALLATPEGGGDLYLLTDLTASSLPGETAFSLPPQLEGKVRLVVSQLDEGPRADRALLGVSAAREGGEGGKIRITAKVRSQGVGSGGQVPLDLSLGGQVVSRGFLPMGADSALEKVFTLPAQASAEGEGLLKLGKDALEGDNAYYFRMHDRRDLKVLVIDGDPGGTLEEAGSFYVERALNPRRSSGSKLTPFVTGEGGLGRLDPRTYAVVYLLNVSDPGPMVERLTNFVKAGGGLFIALGDRVRPEVYNRRLGELLPASLGEIKAASPDLTGEKAPSLAYPEVGHPIFQVFREGGAAVFSSVSFYKFAPTAPSLKPGGEVLLKFSNGLPALLGRQVGAGRVLLFTSSLDHRWGDFPVKSIYLPFVQECSHYLARNPTGEEKSALYTVGQAVVLEVPSAVGSLSVRTPKGELVPLESVEGRAPGRGEGTRRVIYRDAKIPGHYGVIEQTTSSQPADRPELSFAVNVSSREADLSPLPVEVLTRRITGLPVVIEGRVQASGEVELEKKKTLNHWLLWAFLIFLGLEGLAAALRQRAHEQELLARATVPETALDEEGVAL